MEIITLKIHDEHEIPTEGRPPGLFWPATTRARVILALCEGGVSYPEVFGWEEFTGIRTPQETEDPGSWYWEYNGGMWLLCFYRVGTLTRWVVPTDLVE